MPVCFICARFELFSIVCAAILLQLLFMYCIFHFIRARKCCAANDEFALVPFSMRFFFGYARHCQFDVQHGSEKRNAYTRRNSKATTVNVVRMMKRKSIYDAVLLTQQCREFSTDAGAPHLWKFPSNFAIFSTYNSIDIYISMQSEYANETSFL